MRYFNKLTLGLLLVAIMYYTTGCAIFGGGKNKNANREESARAKVENVETLIGANLKDKINEIANLNYGVDYALSKEAVPSKNIQVAKDLNSRSMSLSGAPTVEEMKKMQQMIDDLTSQLADEKERGTKALENKDAEISAIQLESKMLVEAKDAEIRKYMKIAADTAARADAIQTQLDKMNSFFGLGAIWYGFKRLITRMAWILGIGSILYLVLRFASMSNPLAASIFSIFDTMMSWVINVIKVLAPKALEVAGNTATTVANKYRDTMVKMVDNIEALKQIQKKDPTKKFTIDELLTELSKSMDKDEKDMVSKIKSDIGYTS